MAEEKENQNNINILENSEEANKLIETLGEEYRKAISDQKSHSLKMALLAATVFIAVLGASTALTLTGNLSSNAYTLLLGTLVGYVLTFLDDYL